MEDDRDVRARRARFCYEDVSSWKEPWGKEAAQRVKGLSVQIRTQGLMVALASLLRDDATSSRHLADLLARWLLEAAPWRTLRSPEGEFPSKARRLLAACATASRTEYAAAQDEAVKLADQIKLYADALYSS